jgi:hypothetical protein
MFGLFKSPTYTDPQLGRFDRSRGMWRGEVQLPGLPPVPLVLSGNRSEPDAGPLAAARTLATDLPAWLPAIESALHEHYLPYAEAMAAGEPPATGGPVPQFAAPSQVWPHATLQFVAVSPLAGSMTVELGYTVAWDEEHTLGARFQQGRLVELNGSVLPP